MIGTSEQLVILQEVATVRMCCTSGELSEIMDTANILADMAAIGTQFTPEMTRKQYIVQSKYGIQIPSNAQDIFTRERWGCSKNYRKPKQSDVTEYNLQLAKDHESVKTSFSMVRARAQEIKNHVLDISRTAERMWYASIRWVNFIERRELQAVYKSETN